MQVTFSNSVSVVDCHYQEKFVIQHVLFCEIKIKCVIGAKGWRNFKKKLLKSQFVPAGCLLERFFFSTPRSFKAIKTIKTVVTVVSVHATPTVPQLMSAKQNVKSCTKPACTRIYFKGKRKVTKSC